MAIAEDEVAYKLGPDIEIMEAEIEESLSKPVIPKPPLAAPTPDLRKTAAPQPQSDAGPSREISWRDIDLSSFEFPKLLSNESERC